MIIILGRPMTASWTLGLLAGINLVTSGWAIVMVAFARRDVAQVIGFPQPGLVTDWQQTPRLA